MFIRILDYFFFLRPILFFPGWTTILTGYFIARSTSDTFQAELSNTFVMAAIGFTLLMGSAFVINQVHDAATDAANNKLYFISRNLISVPSARRLAWILIIAGLGASAFASISIVVIYLLSSVVFVYLYNYPPFRLKDRVLGSVLANALMGTSALATGWWSASIDALAFLRFGLPFVFLNTAIYFLTTIPDAVGDKAANKRTVAVKWGSKKTIYLAWICFVIASVVSWLNLEPLSCLVVWVWLPIFLLLLWKNEISDILRAIKLSLFSFSLLIGFFFPIYYGLIVFFFVATRWYYRFRFDMQYPSFKEP